jgi:hypothetical protein
MVAMSMPEMDMTAMATSAVHAAQVVDSSIMTAHPRCGQMSRQVDTDEDTMAARLSALNQEHGSTVPTRDMRDVVAISVTGSTLPHMVELASYLCTRSPPLVTEGVFNATRSNPRSVLVLDVARRTHGRRGGVRDVRWMNRDGHLR